MLDWLPGDLGGARCIVASLVSAKDREVDARLEQLAGVIASRRGQVVETLVQRRGVSRARGPGGVRKLNTPLTAATLFGSGKVRELAQLVSRTAATLVVVTNPLKASQRERLESATGCKVVAPAG
jgi:50S ribosomal subunit-associated GTPase HflX